MGYGVKKMTDYIEETLKFIESDEMREYLRDYLHATPEQVAGVHSRRHICATIVCFAPRALERKIPVLELIATQTEAEADMDWDYYDPAKLAQEMRLALQERNNNPPGTVFRLKARHFSEPTFISYELFTSFDAAMRHIKETEKIEADVGFPGDECTSYTIDKYITGMNGVMEEYCRWVLNSSGEIWYFDYGETKFEPDNWDDLYSYLGDMSLPVPFEPGDIILADCRPFAKERRIVIISTEPDGNGTYYNPCIFMNRDRIGAGYIRHNDYLTSSDENSHVSGLYRMVRWKGELSESEAPLSVISTAIKTNPRMAAEIEDYIHINMYAAGEDDNGSPGVSWEQLSAAFGFDRL
jgi:hypothetical protein